MHHRLNATPLEVRRGLRDLRRELRNAGATNRLRDTAEQVLAEVLNNIVEHALAGRQDGQIHLIVKTSGNGLTVRIRDNGCAMPGGSLPLGQLSPLSDTIDSLPEGGFGWYIIHNLTQDLCYLRKPGWNTLSFRIVAS
jgi:serine/threonine-protein kinase RsbW